MIGPSPSEYFLSTVKRSCESLIFSTLSPTPFYHSVTEAALTMRVQLSGCPEGYEKSISLENGVIFSNHFRIIKSLSLRTVDNVGNFISTVDVGNLEIPAPQKRILRAEIVHFKARIGEYRDRLDLLESYQLDVLNPISRERQPLTRENGYSNAYFTVFPSSGFEGESLLKLKSKKWERLKGVRLTNTELDIVWRLWHDALLTPVVAQAMGLYSNGKCAYCGALRPKARHLIYCNSTNRLWDYVWRLIDRMGIQLEKKERLDGYVGKPLVNTVVYLGSVVIYRRFIYNVNSNKVDFDLIKNFKKSLYEKLYLEFTVKKRSELPKFSDFWGDGKGLFRINGNTIDIRL